MTHSPAKYASFKTPTGVEERFCNLTAEPGKNFEEEAAALLKEYHDLSAGKKSHFALRFHLSDITRQAPLLREMLVDKDCFISMIGQPPANGARIALEGWQIDGGRCKHQSGGFLGSKMNLVLNNYRLELHRAHVLEKSGSYEQTYEEFASLLHVLARENGNLADNVHRTWIYCRDIDNNYAGMVKARREIFEKHGLNEHTHYITSTGIEGQLELPNRIISMDSLSVFGLKKGQVEYMTAPDHLSPTQVYGVTFERGTRLIYGDRSTYYLSGTASIDRHGEVVHTGDVRKQTERTLENLSALLENHDGKLSDLKQAVVYLRDQADYRAVAEILANSEMTAVPHIMVKAPVCRPTWLVEIDAIGVNDKGNPDYADFV